MTGDHCVGDSHDATGRGDDNDDVARVGLDRLHAADSPRIGGEHELHARMLAGCWAALPPILVHRPSMRVIDGMHRLRAARLRGEREIGVRFFDGDEDEAFVLAVQTNVTHGLPLSLADRRAAAERIVRAHGGWSNRAIAAVTGLSDKTVAAVRRRLSAEIPQSRTRLGQDGRTRPVDPAEGRRRTSDVLAQLPNASAREVSRRAGVSTSTVLDVRNRVRAGHDPVPPPRRHAAQDRATAKSPADGHETEASLKVLQQLRADPSLRFTDFGRALLRMLEVATVDATIWSRLAAAVPDHHADAVRAMAADAAKAWGQFAHLLTNQQSHGAGENEPRHDEPPGA